MKTNFCAALGALHNQDPVGLNSAFHNLNTASLEYLENHFSNYERVINAQDVHKIVTRAALRYRVHGVLRKHAKVSHQSVTVMEDSLRHHILPGQLQADLADQYGGEPPSTWMDALDRLRELANGSNAELWRMVMDHPMTAYVPVQCQKCGHILPDTTRTTKEEDADLGLTEDEPMPEEKSYVRGGWFRGPRQSVVFVMNCPICGEVSRWFRSDDPKIILNPFKWGRLCGEQENLRLHLARYLGVRLRTAIPLDWDHVWSEYQEDDGTWTVHDDSARNFAARLEECIGAWTGVLAISPDHELCYDATDDYLLLKNEGGRADLHHRKKMLEWKQKVKAARLDPTGQSTQAGTLNGFLLGQSAMSSEEITSELRHAVKNFASQEWWQVHQK